MNLCNAKQKAFAQRVYFDLKIYRRWSKLHVYFDEINKWIFFLGTPSDEQPLTFVLPVSSDEQLSVDDLFNLRSKLSLAVTSDIGETIHSVLMAIVANDFTLGYFNFSFGLPTVPSTETSISIIDTEFTDNMKVEITENKWPTTDTKITSD